LTVSSDPVRTLLVPRPIVTAGVMNLATLDDVRALIGSAAAPAARSALAGYVPAPSRSSEERAINCNVPAKRTTDFPQGARIVIPKNHKVLGQRYDDEVFAILPNRHSSRRRICCY
jgi:hypothetical protein